MSKSKQRPDSDVMGNTANQREKTPATEMGRGTIHGNFLAAIVTSRVYRSQVVKAKKGKGAYLRKEKHRGRESYLMAA